MGSDRSRSRRWARRLPLIALAGASVALAAGCGGGSSSNSSNSSGGTSGGSGVKLTAVTPPASKPLNSITWDLPDGEPTTLDPAKSGDYSPIFMDSQMCDSLLRQDPTNFSLKPGLAKSWNYPNDTTLVLDLQSGVKFWNGKPMTADIVVANLERQEDPKVGGIWGGFFGSVKSITATSPTQVTIKFKQPDELFVKELTTPMGQIVDPAYVAARGKAFGSAKGGVMCSGPYELTKWNSGTDIQLTANPHYWDTSLQPKIKNITVKFITDTSTLTDALASGQIDGAYEIPAYATTTLSSQSTGKLYYGKAYSIYELAYVQKSGPAYNTKVRQALSMMIDRNQIADKILHGAAVPNYTLTPPSAWDPDAISTYQNAYNAIPKPAPDASKAKALIQGVPDASKPMVMALPADDQTAVDMATVIQQEAKQAGLNITLKKMSPLDFSNVFYVPSYRKGIDIVLTRGFLDVADPLDYLDLIVFPNSLFNWYGYNNPTVTKDVQQAQATLDATKRAQLITDAQKLYTQDQVLTALFENRETLYLNDKISGAPASFAYIWLPSLAYLGGT